MALGPELGQEADNWTLARLEHESQRIDTYMATLRNRTRALQAESTRLEEEIRGTTEKIRLNKALPYMIAHITEVFALDVKRAEDDLYKAATGRKSCVIRTSTRETVFLMVPGLVDVADLDPSDVVGVSKDSYLIYEKFPPSFDSRIKAMEVEQRPNESYDRCGGLERQIQELTEAVVWPLLSPWKEMMAEIGIQPPKGVLLWGPAGTGKTMLARACAASTSSTFLRLAASQLVQSFVGDGSRLVRNAFELAKAKAPSIIFIDEIDAIGGKRTHGDGLHGEREVQRTMLELLNQLDGFTALESVKVICATNRPDVLDPALMRSGRLDRKIELPMPNEDARQHILRIHSSKMKLADGVNFVELARATDDFNGAMLKAVCTEAGMLALRRGATSIEHQDFVDGIASVQSKKKGVIGYFS